MAEHVVTQMPGNVWKVNVKPGDAVKGGDTLFILEVMKTELPHFSTGAGTVRKVHVSEGQEGVDGGTLAVEIE